MVTNGLEQGYLGILKFRSGKLGDVVAVCLCKMNAFWE